MQDIIERLDAELGRSPEPTFEVAATVASGRRAVRRRRIAAGAAALVVATVVGGTALATTSGDARGRDGQVAHQPSESASSSALPEPAVTAPPEFKLERGELASYDPQGNVVVRDGWRIVEEIENPLGLTEPERSVGLAITDGKETYWFLLDFDATSMGAASDPAGKAFATLQEWVAHQVDLQQGGEVGDQQPFVVFGADGQLQALPGVEILEQRGGVDLGESFAPPTRSAVAMLDVDGKRWFVAARRLPGTEPEYFPVNTPAAGTTLDEFIAYARAQYAPNDEGGSEGLR